MKLNHTQKTTNKISSSSSEQVYNTVDKLSHQPTVCANRHKITRNKKICIFFAKRRKKNLIELKRSLMIKIISFYKTLKYNISFHRRRLKKTPLTNRRLATVRKEVETQREGDGGDWSCVTPTFTKHIYTSE